MSVSDKTVSKWENGKGIPDISMLVPLCEEFGISVNELLSGERLAETEYKSKAEENIIKLVKENQRSQSRAIKGLWSVVYKVCIFYVAIPMFVLTILFFFIQISVAKPLAINGIVWLGLGSLGKLAEWTEKRKLEYLRRTGMRFEAKVTDILSRLEKGECDMSFKEFDLSEYIAALEEFKRKQEDLFLKLFSGTIGLMVVRR